MEANAYIILLATRGSSVGLSCLIMSLSPVDVVEIEWYIRIAYCLLRCETADTINGCSNLFIARWETERVGREPINICWIFSNCQNSKANVEELQTRQFIWLDDSQ